MSSRLSLILAVVLLGGAAVAGYWGVSLSNQPEEVPVAPAVVPEAAPVERVVERVERRVEQEQRTAVVVLARDLPAMQTLSADDLVIEHMRRSPPDSFASIDELVGRQSPRPLAAGTVLNAQQFVAGGPLARMIRSDERALAIEVDEVVGGGGHLAPTDYVDVLVYLRQDQRNPDQSAQVVVPALRVLSVGRELGPTNSGEQAVVLSEDEAEAARRQAEKVRSVVLAVPEKLLVRMMLASQVGELRLAVRSADEGRLEDYYAGKAGREDLERIDSQLMRFRQLALPQVATRNAGRSAPASVPVFRGNDLSRQTP